MPTILRFKCLNEKLNIKKKICFLRRHNSKIILFDSHVYEGIRTKAQWEKDEREKTQRNGRRTILLFEIFIRLRHLLIRHHFSFSPLDFDWRPFIWFSLAQNSFFILCTLAGAKQNFCTHCAYVIRIVQFLFCLSFLVSFASFSCLDVDGIFCCFFLKFDEWYQMYVERENLFGHENSDVKMVEKCFHVLIFFPFFVPVSLSHESL